MIFITLVKWRQPPKKENVDKTTKRLEELAKQGVKMKIYWTMGRYDAVTITEAPNEKEEMKVLLAFQDLVTTETMVGISRDEVIKLL